MVHDKRIVFIKDEQEVICALSNGDIANNFDVTSESFVWHKQITHKWTQTNTTQYKVEHLTENLHDITYRSSTNGKLLLCNYKISFTSLIQLKL